MELNAPFDSVSSSDSDLTQYRINAGINTSIAPEIVMDIVSVLKFFYKGVSAKIIFNTLIPKLAQTLTSLRIQYKETEGRNAQYPNWYTINLMPSGFGKDRMLKDIDRILLKDYYDWFREQEDKYKEKRYEEIAEKANIEFPIEKAGSKAEYLNERKRDKHMKEEQSKIRNIVPEVSDGTREGLYQDAKALSQADFGSLFIRISEFGTYLYNATQEQKLFLNMLNEAYSGSIASKTIKGEGREHNIENIPTNALFHADLTLFEQDINKIFKILLETGFGRRCSILAQYKEEEYIEESDRRKALREQERYCELLKTLGRRFFELFSSIKSKAIF